MLDDDKGIARPNTSGEEAEQVSGTATGFLAGPGDVLPTATISKERRVGRGDNDEFGDVVEDVHVSTDHFIIYTVKPRKERCTRLRYVLPDDYDTARAYRSRLAPIADDLAFVGDILAGICGTQIWTRRTVLRARTLELMACAIQMAFEERPETAQTLLDRACAEATSRRDSRNRMRYILANGLALFLILLAWLGFESGVFTGEWKGFLTENPGDPPRGFRVVDVLALGAIGAFFSVSAAIQSVRVTHSISLAEMIYAGFVRVPIGVIAAGVVIMLVQGNWILGSIDDGSRVWTIYLFGFLAGFSEAFVPNALKQLDRDTTVRPPASRGPAGPADARGSASGGSARGEATGANAARPALAPA